MDARVLLYARHSPGGGDMKLRDFSMAGSSGDQAALLETLQSFNNTRTAYPRDKTVHGVFAEQAMKTPDAVAVFDGEGHGRTYREVNAHSDKLARFLIQQGLQREDVVGVMLEKAFELTVAILGVLKAGGAYCPIDYDAPFQRMRYLLEDTKARFLLSEKAYIRNLNKLQWDCPQLACIVCLDSRDILSEPEGAGAMMGDDIWAMVGQQMFDDISGGGWTSSYTGEWLSRAVMDEYGENIRQKLEPLLTPQTRVLEIGCSSGISLFRLATRVGFYCGTDLSKKVLEWTGGEVEKRGLSNVQLRHFKADEIDKLTEKDFDVVIINSVIQCFAGHNYLRDVIRKAINLMGEKGVLFFGNLWDQDLKDDYIRSLAAFKRSEAGKGYRTKVDRYEELFISRDFLDDLRFAFPEIREIACSRMLGREKSELSEYGYDAILRVDRKRAGKPAGQKHKQQYDRRIFDDYPAGRVEEKTAADGLAYIIYTSGTSGQPKGTLVEHRSILRLVMNTNYIQLGPQDRILQTGSLAFDASTFEIWGPLLNGGSFCRPGEHTVLDCREIQRLIRKLRITTMWLTTSLFNQYAEEAPGVFADLTTLLTGGEKVSVRHMNAVRKACPDLALINGYGPTENTTFSTYYPMKEPQVQDIPIGAPIANSTVYILDGGGQPVPVGVPGEICTGGDGVARGYLNRPDLTTAKFMPDPFAVTGRLYRTGDLGCWRADGQVMFLGRIDDQVKVRGFRVEPGEIEARIKEFNPVGDVVVVAREMETHGSAHSQGRELVCYFTAQTEVEPDTLRESLKLVLPDYMVPVCFIKLDKLPLTANGKVDKSALPQPELAYQAGSRAVQAPRDATERQLVDIWEEVLGHRGIGTTDNFFDIGGHSLKVVKMVSLIHSRMGLDVPLATIFKAATVRELAERIMDQARFGVRLADESVVALSRNTLGRKVFAFPPGTGDVLSYIPLADLLAGYSLHACNFIESQNRLAVYADIVTEIDLQGPYVLMGYSAGGNLAYQVACELEARGRVVSDLIMLDSARVLGEIRFPEGEVEKVTALFLGHESIRPYVQNSVLRDKMVRKIRSYYEHIQNTVDQCVTGANIHVLMSEVPAGGAVSGMTEYPVSVEAWAEVTRGAFRMYKAMGQHNDMLYSPALEWNAAMLEDILGGIDSRQENS
jgi:amino acid adenylation domain-containing protein